MTPIESMRVVARHLNALDISYTFLGAAVLPLLVDDPALVEIRPTKDVDVGVEIVTLPEHYVLEERLRTAGFRHDTREGAPICRWIVEEHVTADIMPTEAGVLGLESKWFREALQNATERDLGGGITAPVITPPYFLATKLAAYRDRGAADPYMSKDLEDIVTLLDGCEQIVSLVENCDDALRTFIWQELKAHLENADFADAWPGYFRSDQISQQRAKVVRGRFGQLAGI
jgi:predicted nucleotidyltransferase